MLPTILMASAAAALFGSADFMAGLASRRVSAAVVTALSYAVGLVVVAAAAALSPPMHVAGNDLLWSAVSSVAGVVGVVSLYAAFATGRLSIVAPLTAGIAAAGPAVFDIARGQHLSTPALAGRGLAIAAVVVVSAGHASQEGRATPQKAIGLAVLSGVSFAISITAISLVGKAAGLEPLLMQRALGTIALTPVALWLVYGAGKPVSSRPSRSTLGLGVVVGVVDATAMIVMLAAIRLGPLAIASVIAGLYPVVTILRAHFILGERMTRAEQVGVAMALAAVVLTTLP